MARMGRAFGAKLVGPNAAPANWFRWFSQNQTFLTPVNSSDVGKGVVDHSCSAAKSYQKLAKIVWQQKKAVATKKLVGQSPELVGRLPH